jgi:small subunit ribosomal protein S30
MLQIRVDRIISTNFVKNYRSLVTKALENQEEYTPTPVYPPIYDTSKKAKKEENVKLYHETVKNLNTVEEKLIKLNMPKYYGYKCIMLNDQKFPYNCLPLSQYSTRTNFQEAKLEELYKGNDEKCSALVQSVKNDIEETLVFELADRKKNRYEIEDAVRDRHNTSSIISQLNRTILSSLSADNPHLSQVEIDVDPRHEAFWFVGGIPPLTIVQKIREGLKWQKEYAKDSIDRPFQYVGAPYMALRHKLPLSPMQPINLNEQNYQTDKIDIPTYKYDPRTLGYMTDYRHGVSCPGFWPGSPHEFGLLSYQSRDHFKLRSAIYGNSEIDWQEALHAQVT